MLDKQPESAPTKKKTRNRNSKLAKHFHTVAGLLLKNVRLKAEGKARMSLKTMVVKIKKIHGLSVSKSTLSRYISKNNLLKLL